MECVQYADTIDARVLEVLMTRPKLVARFSRVLKEACRYRIMRRLVEAGVEHRFLPNLDRFKIMTEKIGAYRETYFETQLPAIARSGSIVVVPFWYKKNSKTVHTWSRSGAVVGVDPIAQTFVVPPPDLVDLYPVSHLDADEIDPDDVGLARYLEHTERDHSGYTDDRALDVDCAGYGEGT